MSYKKNMLADLGFESDELGEIPDTDDDGQDGEEEDPMMLEYESMDEAQDRMYSPSPKKRHSPSPNKSSSVKDPFSPPKDTSFEIPVPRAVPLSHGELLHPVAPASKSAAPPPNYSLTPVGRRISQARPLAQTVSRGKRL